MARSVVSRSPTKRVEAVSRPAKAPGRRAEPNTSKSQPKAPTPEAGPARKPPKQRSGDAPKTVRAKPEPHPTAAGKTSKKPARPAKKTSADTARGVAAARRENARAARAAWSETHRNTPPEEAEPSPAAADPRAENDRTQSGGSDGSPEALFLTPEVEAFATNMARLWEESGRAMSAYMRPRESGAKASAGATEVMDVVKTLGQVAERWLADPARVTEAQRAFTGGFLDLWAGTLRRFSGEAAEPVVQPDPKDQRFRDPEWSEHPAFDFLKQAYLHASRWAERMVDEAEELDPHTRHKAAFYVKLLSNAVSPSNFVPTNPELIRETLASKGENLVRGMRMLAEDIAAGEGDLRIRQTDPTSFEVGRNLALSPGKVVYRGELFELIQYSPATEMVRTRPIVIVPPWINKFYILDLTPEKSMIKWCVEQGLTVFCVSWVNPDRRHAQKSFEHYMREGIMRAVDVAREICGVEKVDTIGYCVGGTLLAITLAYMAATGDERIASATFMTAQVDFTDAGDLKVFVDEDQIAAVEAHMAQTGYLEGARMANAFNMIRSNDLIWPYVVNNYLKGKAPFPFDLLYWNSDATRMPAANHSFYLRGCYLNNDLAEGRMEIGGKTLDLKKVTVQTYNLATREDHIAPARSVFLGAQLFGGPARFVLSGSGHIAGVVNPPARMKYQHWVGEEPRGRLADWIAQAEERPGSWWPDWRAWLAASDATMVPARTPGDGPYPAIEDAPGSYVKVRA